MELIDLNGFVFTMIATFFLGVAVIVALLNRLLHPAASGRRRWPPIIPAVLVALAVIPLAGFREVRGTVEEYRPCDMVMRVKGEDGRSYRLEFFSLSRKASACFTAPEREDGFKGRRVAFKVGLWQIAERTAEQALRLPLAPSPALLAALK